MPSVALQISAIISIAIVGLVTSVGDVGRFDLAFRLSRAPISFIAAVGVVLLPRVTRQLHTETETPGQDYLSRGMGLTMFLASGFCFGIVGVAPAFVPWYAGREFVDAVILLQVLASSLIIIGWGNVLRSQIIIPRGLDRVYSHSLVSGVLVAAVLAGGLTGAFGVLGAGVALVLSEAFVAAYQTFSIRRCVGLGSLGRVASPYLLAGVGAAVAMLAVGRSNLSGSLSLALQAVLGCLFYVMAVILFERMSSQGFVTGEMRRLLKAVRPRGGPSSGNKGAPL